MAKYHEFTKTIERIERRNNSVEGNPKFRFHFTDGTTATTATNTQFAYEVVERWEGKAFTFKADRDGIFAGTEVAQ